MNPRETRLRITVLTVPDCPNASVVRHRIDSALDGREVPVDWIEVSDEAGAAQWQMTGSPTILLNDVDPFATAESRPSVSCRLYRHPDGTADGAPTTADLRQALAAAGMPASGTD
ncbi:hypothetical protein [Streptomyces swartbergensis]|uniref:Alkylmercury lyase n=1 Tax=Streptomyces swartbergensis TaxID=487165 RepID=A0A243S817_9ACTN|nr:hypothetical protein [Streptomyces swartbergensis]OUD03874.1 hypothetical protein CA983_07170 [Streptomyces swartbergensis]